MASRKPIYLEDVADRSLRLIDGTLDDLERLRRQHRRKQREKGIDDDFEMDFAGLSALDKTTRALSGLLKEIRALSKDAKEAAGKLGPTEQQRLIFDWFSKCSPEHQRSLLLDFQEIHSKHCRTGLEESPNEQLDTKTPESQTH